jgi:hypothetical protein
MESSGKSRRRTFGRRDPRRPAQAAPAPEPARTGKRRKTSKARRKRLLPRTKFWLAVPAALTIALLWFIRPWSEYSPLETLRALDPRRQVELLRSFDEIAPHRVIRADENAASLPRREAPIDASYDWEGEGKLVESFLEEASVTGLLVLDRGVIVHERYRLGADAESRFATFGLAGGVIAALVGSAVQDGLIAGLDDTAETHARSLRNMALGGVRLRDLLAMTAGTEFVEDDGPLGSDTRDLMFGALVLGRDPDRLAARTPLVHPPGQAFDYAASNTQALAAVVTSVYGKPLAFVVEEKIWRPFGMTSDASWSQHRAGAGGAALGFCCWNATLSDIARFGEVMRREGAWGEARLLPEGWIDEAARSSPFAEPGVGGALGPWGYGMHVFIPEGSRAEFLLAGEFGQYLWIDRRRGVVAAMTAADPGWRDRRAEATAVLRAIVAEVQED